MTRTWNRLASPLPDSVLDRYLDEHPDETDPRDAHRRTVSGETRQLFRASRPEAGASRAGRESSSRSARPKGVDELEGRLWIVRGATVGDDR